MQLNCPNCGSRDARVVHRRGFKEWLRGLFGVYPLRCRRCQTRWLTSMWESGAWLYARCPKCYRQELTTWNEKFYNPARSVVIKLSLGAKRYRCAACRCNFASFRRRKGKFTWRHQERPYTPPQVESDPEVNNLSD